MRLPGHSGDSAFVLQKREAFLPVRNKAYKPPDDLTF